MRALGEAGKVTSQESSPPLMTVICFSASFPEKVNARFVADLCRKPYGERTAGHRKALSRLVFFRALDLSWSCLGH